MGRLGPSWGRPGGVLGRLGGVSEGYFDCARAFKSLFVVFADFHEVRFDCTGPIKSLFGVSLSRLGSILPASGGASFGRRSADSAEERFDWACAVKTHFVKICENDEELFKRAGAVKIAFVAEAECRGKRFD